jgi:hypothetical protein
VPCAREIVHKPSAYPVGAAVAETSRHVRRLCATRETILMALLGIRPRGRRWVRTPPPDSWRAQRVTSSASGRWRRSRAPCLQHPVASDVVGVPVGVDDQRQLSGVGVHPVRGLEGVAGEATVDRAGFRPGSSSRLASGKGRCCQVTQGGRRSGSPTACSSLGLMLPLGWCGSPLRRSALELLPVAAVRVLRVRARHPLGKFGVERVGEVGDVA